jgi:hypothetical protein
MVPTLATWSELEPKVCDWLEGLSAVRALRSAERVFPTAVRRYQGVREMLGEMLTRGLVRGAMGVELRGWPFAPVCSRQRHPPADRARAASRRAVPVSGTPPSWAHGTLVPPR